MMDSCFKEQVKEIAFKAGRNKEQITKLVLTLEKKIESLKKDITEAIVQSLMSSDDVHQHVASRIKKRKKRRSLLVPLTIMD